MKPKQRKAKFRVGQRVRVKRRGLPYAIIKHIHKDRTGAVTLDRLIQGFAMWNVEDLIPASRERGETKHG